MRARGETAELAEMPGFPGKKTRAPTPWGKNETLLDISSCHPTFAAAFPQIYCSNLQQDRGAFVMQPVVVESEAELRALIRDRIAEFGTTYGAVEAYAGLPESYVAKLMAPSRIRRFGNRSLPLLLQALALGIARVEFVEDRTRTAKVRKRLVPRRRRLVRPVPLHQGIAAECSQGNLFGSNTEEPSWPRPTSD
ncbi:hypothetical protein LRP30_21750 [Bradyrhizobium sp. C-145]|uniref:hypothetical protein n=1 Tax=Bradyrhizobium sp. C-145 TaxID=574727 RepID=UPI00201B898F|nr:hypothetical protein [Bradyrhizobium sp. C-145]UQR67715.1 hypothetical protein LRP30_21750 [Bradyrhizobium sp. C-145]